MSFHKNLRGSDLHAPSIELVEYNGVGSIAKLKVATFDGMGTVYPQVRINDSSVDTPLGIMQCDIASGKSGYIFCLGFMFDVDTSAWAPGTSLYSDSSGNLTTVSQGGEVAKVIKQDAVYGTLYVTALGNFLTSSQGDQWSLTGNAATNPSLNFLGTTDSQPLKFRTNDLPVGQFDVNGRLAIGAHNPDSPLHVKSYPGYSGSGYKLDTFALTSDTTNYVPSYAITLTNGQVLRVKYQVTCRQSDGTARASFTRSALFYKDGGNVTIQGPNWSSDFTMKSNNAFNISFTTGVTDIIFSVKNASPVDTYWSGHVEMEIVSTST